MTYTVPPKKPDPKQRFVRVTDPAEIEAIQRNGSGLIRYSRRQAYFLTRSSQSISALWSTASRSRALAQD